MSGRSPYRSPLERLREAALAYADQAAEEGDVKWRRADWRLRRAAREYRDAPRGARGPKRASVGA